MAKRAALYLRSSKDRSAVSIQAQRRELLALAQTRNLIITAEFADAVESGKDVDRPGFQQMLPMQINKTFIFPLFFINLNHPTA